MVNLRIATKNDAEVLLSLSRKTFTQAFAAQNTEADMKAYLAENFTLARIREELKVPGVTFLLAYVNEQPAGYAKLSNNQNPTLPNLKQAELERIYVLQKFQGHQAGKSLLELCLALAKQSGAEVLWLGVWEHNQKAIDFYRKFGFQQFGQHVFMLGSDAQNDLLLRLDLA
ncbi:GNAT family N-acetyltransferase [Adhaeribacter soli]|uniref:GNAT family N-acetyltransferase n=1 Tax=Adhaeribacter soli TaxID=2607655 RepID=A0A5N1IMD9_9BACT|nr:GNAT family N-acetyltransferase [Adhaeribacter soli]KAA9331242.1 GNAT family N-acetyltransferase [Adhaeribacter soli]